MNEALKEYAQGVLSAHTIATKYNVNVQELHKRYAEYVNMNR